MADIERIQSTASQESSCATTCPKFKLCEAMKRQGLANKLAASMATHDSGVEYEADDGRLVTGKEFFGIPDMSAEKADQLTSAGAAMIEAGETLQGELITGCADGAPIELGTGEFICASENRNAVEFTEADLQ